MRTLIEGYRNHPGEHCGSVAMRGLLEHYCGLQLAEGPVFGLGAGLHCLFIAGTGMDPSPVVFGRTGSMELDLAANLGVDYREQVEPDDALAWQQVREEVLADRPTMLTGDILYLDYREYKVHFPSHRFVLLGFDDDDEKAYIADRINEDPERCSYGALALSRNPPEGMSTVNRWGRFHGTEVARSPKEAARSAIETCAQRMLDGGGESLGPMGEGGEVVSGVAGIRRFAADLPSWPGRDDLAWVASYNARCIEKFGNGGGNFRRLYAAFLEWARQLEPGLVPAAAPSEAVRAADGWTELSGTLYAGSQEGADASLFGRAADQAVSIAEIEESLFSSLLEAVR